MRAFSTALLRRSLRYFLPIAGGITLVLVPMAMLYEQSRRQTLQARVDGLLEAGSVRANATLQEALANTGVVLTVPAFRDVASTANPSPAARARLAAVFRAQLREYERFSALAVLNQAGEPLVMVQRAPGVMARVDLGSGLEQARQLGRNQLWLSPVTWRAPGQASLWGVRPVEDRRSFLAAEVSLAPLARDFDRIANAAPALQRGYLLSSGGQVINQPPGMPAEFNFAARFPQLWRAMQQRDSGVVDTGSSGGGDGLFQFRSGLAQRRIAVVIQVPRTALYRTSAFAQPAGQALVLLLYLLAAGASTAVAIAQQRLQALRQEQQRLIERMQAVNESAGVGMCLCDPVTGRFLTVNAAMCSFFDRPPAELQACNWQELTHPEDLAIDQQMARQLHRGEFNSYRLRKRFLRRDGSTIWGDLVVACTRNPDGSIRDLIGQISDVSELVAKSAYLEAASSAGVVGVWDWDIEHDVLTWDPVMYRLYGLRAEDFKGTREAWEQALHPEDQAFVLQELQAALRGWREYQPRFRVVWPDGSIRYVQARSRTIYGPDGAAVRMIGVNYDVTEQVERELEVEQQRAQLAATLDALLDPLLFLTLETAGLQWPVLRIAESNPAACGFLGRSHAQLVGQPLSAVLPEATNSELLQALMEVYRQGVPWVADEQPMQLSHASNLVYADVRAVAGRDGVVLSFRDVTARRRDVMRLAESEERFRLLAENSSDAVFLNAEGIMRWMSPAITTMLGWRPDDWIGHQFVEFCHPDDIPLALERRAEIMAGATRVTRLRLRDQAGSWHWVEVHSAPYRNPEGEQVGIAGSMRTIDQEVATEAELDRRARTDELTGLLNRKEIFERLTWIRDHRRHSDDQVAVLFCDIDHFKAINDRHGHAGGDAVLIALATRIQACTRQQDLVGRIGGDELLVVLQGMPSLQPAEAIAAKIHAAARDPLQLATGEVVPTLSIGVTLIREGESIDAVVERADQAMYQAKQHGRDRVIAFS